MNDIALIGLIGICLSLAATGAYWKDKHSRNTALMVGAGSILIYLLGAFLQ